MTVVTKTIGRLPMNKGDWDANYVNPKTGQNGYGLKFRTIRYGCELESKMENNTYDPIAWDGAETFTIDTAHWLLISGSPEAWLDGQDKPATTGTTGDYPYNGMGQVVLKKHIVEVGGVEKNLLYQDDFKKGPVGERVDNENTIFVIKYDFELAENVIIPAGCVLKFEGGSISNGTITFQNTIISSVHNNVFDNVLFAGTIGNIFKVSWIKFTTSFSNYNAYTLASITHVAKNSNSNIDWNIKEINLDIPNDFGYCDLCDGENDFKGLTLNIKNTQRERVLFREENSFTSLSASSISDAVANSVFTDKIGLLVIEDTNAITSRGEDPIYRKDIIVVENNVALNDTIDVYSDGQSSPKFSYYIPKPGMSIRNLNIKRTGDSTEKTYILSCLGVLQFTLDNVNVITEEGDELIEDFMFMFYNSAFVTLKNLTVNKTYSLNNHSGYVIDLQNVFSTVIENVALNGNWGVIAGDNVNGVIISNSTLNRMDSHCYSRDFLFKHCVLNNLYTQISYHKGYIKYEDCDLRNYIPILNYGSYGCSFGINLVLKNCRVSTGALLTGFDTQNAATRNLTEYNSLPNIYAENCEFYGATAALVISDGSLTTPENNPVFKFKDCVIKRNNGLNFVSIDNAEVYIDGCRFFTRNTEYAYCQLHTEATTLNNLKFFVENSKLHIYDCKHKQYTFKNCDIHSTTYGNQNIKNCDFYDCNIYLDSTRDGTTVNIHEGNYYGCTLICPSNRETDNIVVGFLDTLDARFDNIKIIGNVKIKGRTDVDVSLWQYLKTTFHYTNTVVDDNARVPVSLINKVLDIPSVTPFKVISTNSGSEEVKYVVGGAFVTKTQYYS